MSASKFAEVRTGSMVYVMVRQAGQGVVKGGPTTVISRGTKYGYIEGHRFDLLGGSIRGKGGVLLATAEPVSQEDTAERERKEAWRHFVEEVRRWYSPPPNLSAEQIQYMTLTLCGARG